MTTTADTTPEEVTNNRTIEKNGDIIIAANVKIDAGSTEKEMSARTLVVRMFLLAVCHIFMNASRQPVWILYASEFDHTSLDEISWILLIGLIWRGISGLLYVSFANTYGYDKAVLILLSMLVSAILIECLATSFWMFSVGFFLSQVSLVPVVLSAIAWLLPHRIAINYTSYLFASIIIAFLIGPAVSGVIAYFVSYKFVFWINFIVGVITLIYALLFIPFNAQHKIEKQQLKTMAHVHDKQNNITMDNEAHKQQWDTIQIDVKSSTNKETKAGNIMNDDDMYPICLMKRNRDDNKKHIHLSRFEWFMLISSIGVHVFVPFGETVMGLYYCLYVMDNLKDSNIMIASMQLLLVAVTAIIGKLSAPKIIEKCSLCHNKYMILMLCSVVGGFMMFIVYPNTENIAYWYLYALVAGYLLGTMGMTSQIVILEYQPSSHAGYVNGISELLRSVAKAIGLFIVGLFWAHNETILWDVMGAANCIQLILSLMMAIADYNHYLNKNDKMKETSN
eukprot:100202_1